MPVVNSSGACYVVMFDSFILFTALRTELLIRHLLRVIAFRSSLNFIVFIISNTPFDRFKVCQVTEISICLSILPHNKCSSPHRLASLENMFLCNAKSMCRSSFITERSPMQQSRETSCAVFICKKDDFKYVCCSKRDKCIEID